MSLASFTVLIPARLASTRLPNKALAMIGPYPMVVHVALRAKASAAVRVVVATDSLAIVAACDRHGVESVMTRADHVSGSDRLAEACAALGLDETSIVVNVQGDEPMMDPALIDAVAGLLQADALAVMSTAAHAMDTAVDFLNPNVVKVVLDAQCRAIYFSRAPIPFARSGESGWLANGAPPALRHIGIYAYRVGFLKRFPELAASPLEHLESLEQLRVLWHGHKIAVHVCTDAPGPGVDTPQDLERVRDLMCPP